MANAYTINYPKWRVFKDDVSERQVRLMTTECQIVARRYIVFGPFTTGRLAASMYTHVEKTTNGHQGTFGSRLKYASSVNDGAKRHIIRPRAVSFGHGLYGGGPFRGGKLHFYWHRHGVWVTARKVNHPGQRGKHFLQNALISVARRRGFKVILH